MRPPPPALAAQLWDSPGCPLAEEVSWGRSAGGWGVAGLDLHLSGSFQRGQQLDGVRGEGECQRAGVTPDISEGTKWALQCLLTYKACAQRLQGLDSGSKCDFLGLRDPSNSRAPCLFIAVSIPHL